MRIAPIALFILLAAISSPSIAQTLPTQSQYSVPINTTDPELVRRGVDEWLVRHPEFQPYQRAAILKRMRQESGFQPCVRNGPHHYLLQWRDQRVRELWQHAGVRPGTCPSWLAQLEHMKHELESTPRFTRFFNSGPGTAYVMFSRVYLGGRI